ADELAAAINANPATASGGMRAVSQGGHVFLQSLTEGATETVTLTGGSALSALGWSPGLSSSGSSNPIAATISGSYVGTENQTFTLVPTGNGTIGTTPGLTVEVFDSSGIRVGTLDVGEGYQPGTPLTLASGLKISLGFGELSASQGDRLQIEALADSDTSDVLVGLGMNAFYAGAGAEDMAVRADLALDPRMLSVSKSGAVSDNGALEALLDIRDMSVDAFAGISFGEYYGDLVGGVGFDIEAATNAREVEQFLTDTLNTRREQISGVNIDEELVNMIQFQQSYSAAARYITVVNATSEEVLRLL
ncbi:MAG: flagellar basal body rod C-terminal domain-containing protein, partial [Planctomycetia bacterium]